MDQSEEAMDIRLLFPAIFVSTLLIIGIFFAFFYTKSHTLPPTTYHLPTTTSTPTVSPLRPTISDLQPAPPIPVPPDATWTIYNNQQFPYTFLYPSPLSLGVFPNDPYYSVTVFYKGTNDQDNLFFRVENLNTLGKQEFIAKSKLEYANAWWKDYSWQGVASISAFTNAKGLKGYRATYRDTNNQTPYDHIFFEVPGRADLVIWISGKLFSPQVFDRIVDSVSWKSN